MWPKLLVECFPLTQYLLSLPLPLSLPLSIIYLQYFLIQNEAASHSELLMAKHAAQVQRRCLCLLPALSPCWGHTPLADPISSFSSIPSSIATRSHQQSSSPPRLLHFFCSLLPFLPALSPLLPPPLSHSWSPKSSRLNLQNLPAAFAVSVSVSVYTSFFLFLLLLAYFL